ncbi:MAG: regulator [Nitrospirae bacterium]|nr:regulator [Nitrospirota bacterium]
MKIFSSVLLGILLSITSVACSTQKKTESPGPMDPKLVPMWTSFAVNSDVHALAFEGNSLWVGTEMGLLRYDLVQDQIVDKFTAQNGLLSNYIYQIVIDAQGTKWIGTLGGGLARYDGKGWQIITMPQIADPFVYDILFDKQGNMWVATWSGLSVKRGDLWQTYTTKDGLSDNWVYALDMDDQGNIWAGTEGGVSRFDGKKWTRYTHQDGLGASQEVIGPGDPIYNPSVHHKSEAGKAADTFNPNYVLSVLAAPGNHLWFGTWGAGLSRFDGQKWKTYTTRDGLAGNFVTDLYVDKEGLLWATTEGGVSIFDGKRWKRYTREEGLVDDSIYTVTPDASGRLWFGTISGISKLEGYAPLTPPPASSGPSPSRS